MSLYPSYHFPFCLLFHCLLSLPVSVALSLCLSLSLNLFKGLKSVQTIWCVFLLECSLYLGFSRLSSAGNIRKHIRLRICLASSHFVRSESFNFMASARQQPEGRIRKPSVWNDIACTVHVYRLTRLSTIPHTHTHTHTHIHDSSIREG